MGKGFDKERLPDGVIVYTIHSTRADSAEEWFQDVKAEFAAAAEAGQPARLVYDITELGLPSHPAILERARQLSKVTLPEDWRVATVTHRAIVSGIIDSIRKASLSEDELNRSQIFGDRDEALAWLREAVARGNSVLSFQRDP